MHDVHGGRAKASVQPPRWEHVVSVDSEAQLMSVLQPEALALVFLYVPWSESAVSFYQPLDEIIAGGLQVEEPPVPVVAVDLTRVPELGKQHHVQNFPTFVAFRYGMVAPMVENQFPRHATGVLRHVLALARPAVDSVSTVEALGRLISTSTLQPIARVRLELLRGPEKPARPHPDDMVERTIIVAFTDDDHDRRQFESSARLLGSQFRLAIAPGAVARAFQQHAGSVVIFRRWGSGPVVHPALPPGTWDLRRLARYVVANAVGPAGIFDDDSRTTYAQRHKPLLIVFTGRRIAEGDPLFADLATLHEDAALNVTVAQSNPNYAGRTILHFLGIDASGASQSVGLLVGRRKYRYDPHRRGLPLTAVDLAAFIRAAVNGSLPEYHRSEARSAMRHGTGECSDLAHVDFHRYVVEDKAKDAILLLYNPSTRASRDLAALFDDLAAAMKPVAGVLVGRLNLAENDYHDAFMVPGHPSILYARRDRKSQPIRMTAAVRTLENVRAFIAENAAVSLGTFAPSNQTPGPAPEAPEVHGAESGDL